MPSQQIALMDPIVPEFMVRRLDGRSHPAAQATPDSGIVYHGRSSTWVSEIDDSESPRAIPEIDFDEVYAPCKAAQRSLIATVDKLCKKKGIPSLYIASSHSWTEVEESALSVCDIFEKLAKEDNERTPGFTGKLKQGFRSLCRNAQTGKTLLSLLPDGDYTSVLCGGLKIIFKALEEADSYRQAIYNALEDLPSQLNDHSKLLRLNQDDEELHRRSALLYAAVFGLLETICSLLLKSKLAIGSKLLLKSEKVTRDLKDEVDRVRKAAQSFVQRLSTLAEEDRHDTRDTLNGLDQKASILLNVVGQILHIETQKSQRSFNFDTINSRLAVLDKLGEFLNTQEALTWSRAPTPTPEPSEIRTMALEKQPQVHTMSVDELLHLLRYDPRLVYRDCENIIRTNMSPGYDIDEDRIAAIQRHPRFQAFLSLNEPSMLAVNAHFASTSALGMSSISAKIFRHAAGVAKQAGSTSTQLIPLAFFCGQHRDRHGGWDSVAELALCLLLQLLDRHRAFKAETLQTLIDKLDPRETDSICAALAFLFSKLPATAIVLLIIDGADYFKQPRYGRDTRPQQAGRVVEHLVNVYRHEHSATLKILFANATRVNFIDCLLTDDEALNMPRDLSSGGDYDARAWESPMKLKGLY